MFNDAAEKRAFAAEIQVDAANARFAAAVTERDLARQDVSRMERELFVVLTIAAQAFSTLVKLDPCSASRFSESVLSHYGRYQENCEFPNVADLLATMAKVAPMG